MLGWFGFWIFLSVIVICSSSTLVKRWELQRKYPKIKFKWYDYIF